MSWLDLPRTDEPEDIDDPDQEFADVAHSMRDLARTNSLFGGVHTVLHHVTELLKDVPRGAEARVLDIATGSGDIPRALHRWADHRGLRLTIVGVDNLPAMLRMTRQTSPQTALVQADACALPFAPRSFDIALCALAFHHLGFDSSVRVMRTMDTLTTRGFVISDLRRDRPSLWAVEAGMALLRVHPFTRHDGPASVRRAFTLREYEKMAALSGVNNIRIRSHLHFRIAIVQNKRRNCPNWV